jgi:hypothetical protein
MILPVESQILPRPSKWARLAPMLILCSERTYRRISDTKRRSGCSPEHWSYLCRVVETQRLRGAGDCVFAFCVARRGVRKARAICRGHRGSLRCDQAVTECDSFPRAVPRLSGGWGTGSCGRGYGSRRKIAGYDSSGQPVSNLWIEPRVTLQVPVIACAHLHFERASGTIAGARLLSKVGLDGLLSGIAATRYRRWGRHPWLPPAGNRSEFGADRTLGVFAGLFAYWLSSA